MILQDVCYSTALRLVTQFLETYLPTFIFSGNADSVKTKHFIPFHENHQCCAHETALKSFLQELHHLSQLLSVFEV